MNRPLTQQDVIDYYVETSWDYRILLRHGEGHWGMHYGYKDKKHRTLKDSILNQNRVLANMVPAKAGMKVLEVGCGIGGTSLWLAKNRDARVTGVNIVEPHIERAKSLAKQMGLSKKTTFLIRDMRDTRLPAHSFDVVIAVECVCYLENKNDFIKEAYRVLKPGGVLVMSDGFLKNSPLTDRESKRMKKWLDGWALPNLAVLSDFKKGLDRAGFKKIQIRDTTDNVLDFSRFLYKWGLIGLPLSELLEALGKRTYWGTANITAAIWQFKTLKKRVWTHNMIRAEK